MKRVILVFLLSALIPLANASLPLPQVVSDVGPGGGIITSLQAQAELQNQYLHNQMLREQIAMVQQQEQEANARSSSNNQLTLFNNEYEAQNHCPSDTVVWLNLPTGIWHYKGARWYGNTKHGSYVCKEEALMAGNRGSLNGQ